MEQTQSQNQDRKIIVKSDESIDVGSISIILGEGLGWHTTVIPIVENGKVDVSHFPTKAGIYNLTINYSNTLFYNEVLLYRLDPNRENLSFDFYRENSRIFCRIQSLYATELNKEIVMNEITEEMKLIFETIEKEN